MTLDSIIPLDKCFALPIKSQIIQIISPLGWSGLITRAMPELMEINPKFSAYRINKLTTWSYEEVLIVCHYMKTMYEQDISQLDIFHTTQGEEHNQLLEVNYFKPFKTIDIKKSLLKIMNFFKL